MKSSVSTLGVHDTLRDFSADRRLLVLSAMAIFTGSFGAGAAWVLRKLIALVTNFAYFHVYSTATTYLSHARLGPASILIPVVGGLIVGLMARFGSQKIRGHGIPEALEAILIGQSRIEPKVAVLKPLSSAIAIGTGGPFGAEGPIIMTGGALGSLFAQFFHLSSAERKTLLVAGAAAGMTAIFGTPVAAVLLAIEVMLFEWKPRSFVPVVVSAIVAMAWRPWLVGAWPLFPHAGIPAMPWWGLALCAAVGVVAGLQSAITTGGLYWVEELFEKLPLHWMWWPALAGIVVGVGGLIDPAALGVGYDNIQALISGSVLMHAAIALLLVKGVIWVIALASGTSGGTLAPLLMMGGAVGALEAHVLPFGDPGFWALIAMAAVLGGTLRCPADGDRVRHRAHGRSERDARSARRVRRLIRRDGADHAPLHPDGAARPARAASDLRIHGRSVRGDAGERDHDAAGGHAAGAHVDGGSDRILRHRERRQTPQELSGHRRCRQRRQHGLARRRAALVAGRLAQGADVGGEAGSRRSFRGLQRMSWWATLPIAWRQPMSAASRSSSGPPASSPACSRRRDLLRVRAHTARLERDRARPLTIPG